MAGAGDLSHGTVPAWHTGGHEIYSCTLQTNKQTNKNHDDKSYLRNLESFDLITIRLLKRLAMFSLGKPTTEETFYLRKHVLST